MQYFCILNVFFTVKLYAILCFAMAKNLFPLFLELSVYFTKYEISKTIVGCCQGTLRDLQTNV